MTHQPLPKACLLFKLVEQKYTAARVTYFKRRVSGGGGSSRSLPRELVLCA